MHLNPAHPALSEKRTIHTKTIRLPSQPKNILKPASANSKLGKRSNIITKGKWKGMRMFSLTLEERKTCPSDCFRWAECYGNAMPFAHRFEHGSDLTWHLYFELEKLAEKYPEGFVVRLHILGDFYSWAYAMFWRNMLELFPPLHIFGYTARKEGDIHDAIIGTNAKFPERHVVRISTNKSWDQAQPNKTYASNETVGKSFDCPEQTKKTESCLTCGLCWTVNNTVRFQDHDKLRKGVTV